MKLLFFSTFFSSNKIVLAALLIKTIINISKIISDTTKIFIFLKMGNSLLEVNTNRIFFSLLKILS